MNNAEIRQAIDILRQREFYLEEEYAENGGEVTESTEQQEAEIAAIRELLCTEGVDSLGRWLKGMEDKVKALKAEKDSVSKQIERTNGTIDYIKGMVNQVLTASGEDKVKGTFYSFTKTDSVKTSVEKDILKGLFQSAVEEALRGGEHPVIPADVTITLGASVSALPEGTELPEYYTRTITPTAKFTKPRANKGEE